MQSDKATDKKPILARDRWPRPKRGQKFLKESTRKRFEDLTRSLYRQLDRDTKELDSRLVVIKLGDLERPVTRFSIRRSEFPWAKPGDKLCLTRCDKDEGLIQKAWVVSVGHEDVKVRLLKPIEDMQVEKCKLKMLSEGIVECTNNAEPPNVVEVQLKKGDTIEWTGTEKIGTCSVKFCRDRQQVWQRRVECALIVFNQLKRSTLIQKCILGAYKDCEPQLLIKGSVTRNYIKNMPEPTGLQKKAIEQSIRKKISLVEGVAGSGKTLIALNVAYYLSKYRGSRVLICSPNQASVDAIAEKLKSLQRDVKAIQIPASEEPKAKRKQIAARKELGPGAINKADLDLDLWTGRKLFARAGVKLSQSILANHLSENRLRKEVANASDYIWRKEQKKVLESSNIVCCTLAQAGSASLRRVSFGALIIDDAHLASELDCMIALMAKGLKQVTLLGDVRRSIRLSKAYNPPGNESVRGGGGGCARSKSTAFAFELGGLFERWLSEGWAPVRLLRQHRMRPQLANFPRVQFYSSELKTDSKATELLETSAISHGKEFPWLPDSSKLTALFDTPTNAHMIDSLVAKITNNLISHHKVQRNDIGVISNVAISAGHAWGEVKFGSVEDFIGTGKKFIILVCYEADLQPADNEPSASFKIDHDFTRNDLALHIALTRASLGLFIVMGHSSEAWKTAKIRYIDEGSTNSEAYCQGWQDLYKYYKDKKLVEEAAEV